MSSMFRSPNSESSSSEEDDVNERAASLLELQESATESINDIPPSEVHLGDQSTDWLAEVSPEVHGGIMTHSLLEFVYTQRAAEILNTRPGSHGRYTRHSPEAVAIGRTVYQEGSQQLSSQGWIPPNIDQDEWASLRQAYREGLDYIGMGSIERELEVDDPVARAISPALRWPQTQTDRPSRILSPIMRSVQAQGTSLPRSNPALRRLLPGGDPNHPSLTSITAALSSMQLPSPTATATVDPDSSTHFPLLAPTSAVSSMMVSRYASEYSQVKLLGKGGYGKVYHVTNHVDGQHYAIKKIPLTAKRLRRLQEDGRKELDTILREIRTLARLEHSNVVRYFGAWIEQGFLDASVPTPVPQFGSPTRALLNNTSDNIKEGPSFGGSYIRSGEQPAMADGGSDDGIVFGKTSNSFKEEQATVGGPSNRSSKFRRESQASRNSFVRSVEMDDEEDEDNGAVPREALFFSQTSTVEATDEDIFSDGFGERESRMVQKVEPGPAIILHIQMSLHPLSLATYLSPLPNADSSLSPVRHCYHPEPSVRLLLAILGGIEYLHAQDIVHRDIKPGNIFLAESLAPTSPTGSVNVAGCPSCDTKEDTVPVYITPRIGDFGLVADISGSTQESPDPTSPVVSIGPCNGPVGTEFYRPLVRTTSIDEKVDVFALGVVLFELLWKFNTRMERHVVLADLGKGVLPKRFSEMVTGPDGTDTEGTGEPRIEVGRPLGECIKGMVESDANERFGCAEVRRRLEGILTGIH